MVDHLAWAQGYRDRAAKCQVSAKSTSSVEFGECYRLLEKYYLMLANLEEDFGRKQVAALMPHGGEEDRFFQTSEKSRWISRRLRLTGALKANHPRTR